MAQRHGLGGLQVREARHHRIGVEQRLLGQGQLKIVQCRVDRVERVADPEAEIERHLVVARARRMEPSCGLADDLGEARLDVHMDVLQGAGEREGAGLDFARDPV